MFDPQLVRDVLTASLTSEEELPRRGDSLGYEIGCLLDYLARSGADVHVQAGFEFAFFRALEHHRYPRALYAALADNPDLFVERLSRLYQSKNGPRKKPDQAAELSATQAWHVLHDWHSVPGLAPDGEIDGEHLTHWIDSARLKLRDADRADVGDHHIGQLLAGSPEGADGAWPAEPVRDVMERLGSSEIEDGFRTGKFNLRGPTSRGVYDGGGRERSLATQFRAWSSQTAGRWPRTSRLLGELSQIYERDAIREDLRAQADADAG